MLNEYIEFDQYTKDLQTSRRFGNTFADGEFVGYERAVLVLVRGFLYGHNPEDTDNSKALIKEGEALSREENDKLLRCTTRFVQAWLGKWRKEWQLKLARNEGTITKDTPIEVLKWEEPQKVLTEVERSGQNWKEIDTCLGKVFVELPASEETLGKERTEKILDACQKAFPKVCISCCEPLDRRRAEIKAFHNPQEPFDSNPQEPFNSRDNSEARAEYLKGADGETPNSIARLLCDVRKEVEEGKSEKKEKKLKAVDNLINSLSSRFRGLSKSMMFTDFKETGDNTLKTLYMEKIVQRARQIGPLKNYALHQGKPADPLENVRLCYLDHTIDIKPESAGGQFIFRTLAAYLKAQKEQEGPVASDYQVVNISDLKNWGGTKKYSKKGVRDFELPQFLSFLRYEENGQKYLLFETEIVNKNTKKIKVCKKWIDKYGFTLVERQDDEFSYMDYLDEGRVAEGRTGSFIRRDKIELAPLGKKLTPIENLKEELKQFFDGAPESLEDLSVKHCTKCNQNRLTKRDSCSTCREKYKSIKYCAGCKRNIFTDSDSCSICGEKLQNSTVNEFGFDPYTLLDDYIKAVTNVKNMKSLKKQIQRDYKVIEKCSLVQVCPGDTVSFKTANCNLLSKKDKYTVKGGQSRNYLEVESQSKKNAIKVIFELEFLPDGNLKLHKGEETILLQPIN